MKFIHITDPHLTEPGKMLWGTDPCDRLSRCLDDIARLHGDAAFCVISGDLTEAGEKAAYEGLQERLKNFPIKTFLMLGNHDDRPTFQSVFPHEPSCDGGYVQQSFRTDQGVFILLDTKKEGQTSAGELCETRRRWLVEQLADAGRAPVYLFMHHPPFEVGLPHMDPIKLDDPGAFVDVISAGANIRHIFFGHVHRAGYFNWRGISCTSLPGTNHQVAMLQDSVGTTYSAEPAMYGIVSLNGDQINILFDAYLDRAPIPGT